MKAKKTPWHLRFAGKMKTAASAVVVGIALLVGSNAAVQAACYPPVYAPCFHKKSGSWSSSGYATIFVDFEVPSGKSSQLYEVEWNGLKKLFVDGDFQETYESVSRKGISGSGDIEFSYDKFWWEPYTSWNSYGCSIYEGHYDGTEWVRGDKVAQVDFYAYQEADLIYLNTSAASFSLSQYYGTLDWEPKIPAPYLLHGYTEGYWEGSTGIYRYHGDPGSPRFHYRSKCSVTIQPPARTSRNTRPR